MLMFDGKDRHGIICTVLKHCFIQDALAVPVFSGSEEARVAEELLDAYRTGDAEAVRQCVASHAVFLELDNQVRARHLCKSRLLLSNARKMINFIRMACTEKYCLCIFCMREAGA